MDTASIRRVIAAACDDELKSDSLRRFFAAHIDTLEQVLSLPADAPLDALIEFAGLYISHVPDFLEEIASASRTEGAYPEILPFLHMAEDFFLAPPDDLEGEQGLKALLDEAFLAQRLIEEVNDRHLIQYDMPLIQVDMTRANIIVHHLIGDALAGRLENLVRQCVELLMDDEQRFAPLSSAPERNKPWKPLPCMCLDSQIGLKFEG